MKKIKCIIACLCLLILTSCHSSEPISLSEAQISPDSFQKSSDHTPPKQENTTPSSEYETLPHSSEAEDKIEKKILTLSSKISVPIQIITENDAPNVYATSREHSVLGTEEHLRIYNEWITKLDGASITAIYGYSAPAFEYTKGKMSLEDSQTLFNKLKSIRPSLLSEADLMNPYTGGGMSLSIQTKEERAVITFNGGWFGVYLDNQKQSWIFDVQGKSVQAACYEIDHLLCDNMNNGEQPDLFYKNAKVENIYAINTNSYVMANVVSNGLSKEIISNLETYEPTGTNPDGFGYLILTENGKEYIYLDDTNTFLTKNCLAALTNAPLHPSWLIHMTPSRIVSANGVTNQEKLLALSKFLKEKVTVQSETSHHEGPTNPSTVAGLYCLKIDFNSGTRYDLIGYDHYDGTGNFSLYTSDLDRTVEYKLDNGVSAELSKFLNQLK